MSAARLALPRAAEKEAGTMSDIQSFEFGYFSTTARMESIFPMKAQRRKKKPAPGIRRQLPAEFICIAPDESKHVVAWLSGLARKHEEEIAQLHYHLCLHCQEATRQLIRRTVSSSKPKEYVHPGESQSEPQARLKGSPVKIGHDNPDQAKTHTAAPAAKPLSMKAGGEG
jgi:hypothetical protein